MTGATVECVSKIEGAVMSGDREGPVFSQNVREWLTNVPDGATITHIVRDFGNQRDPDVRLIGLRASWSETR